MVHERPPLQLDDLPAMFVAWVQEAGGFAAVGLALWLIAYALDKSIVAGEEAWPGWAKMLFRNLALLTGLSYLIFGLLWLADQLSSTASAGAMQALALTIGGAFALLAVGLPFVRHLGFVQPRRIWALARLTIQESVRSKVLWIFSFLALIFLFGGWFVTSKPEDELRTYVQVIYWAMTPLLLATGVILAAFGIPNDLRHQTLHTIVTKPVERFEIILGRFLGYTLLMTAVLVVMTGFSLLYLAIHAVHPQAETETQRARVPVYGNLEFGGLLPGPTGIRDIKEWRYRGWIPGGPASQAHAVWVFAELPGRLDERTFVPCEFSFDIYRMTKGEENRGVRCSLTFQSWRWSPANKLSYDTDLRNLTARAVPVDEINNRLAERYGYYELPHQEIFNHRTYRVDVPVGLFKNALAQERVPQAASAKSALVFVSVHCDQDRQLLGMAKHDLYLLDAEGWFSLNFFKGALGLWFRLCLIIGVAVACSTYLSGVVSLMCALFVYGAGLGREFISKVAANTLEGGGPAEQMLRIVRRQDLTSKLEVTPTTQTAGIVDEFFRWLMRRLVNSIPDVDRFDLSQYVSEGFDISATNTLICTIMLVGYLLPWAVLAYYLLKSREVAS
jgi:ABC-type transport system involved in multi-copper enzyme maturation permease subunit